LNGPSFKYDFFHFLEPMSEGMMNLVLVVLLICAIGITIGKFFKLSAVVFTLLFAYIFFLDRGYYNNHLYLFFLLTFLLSFSKANSALSLDKKARKIGQLPRYLLLIIQLQIVIVYFYGGIAKLNSDWLFHQEPVQAILRNVGDGSSANSGLVVYFLTYGGVLFDLLIGFGLFWKKTRTVSILAAIIFNVANAILFDDINIFPFMMLFSLVLFVDSSWLRKMIGKVFKKTNGSWQARKAKGKEGKLVLGILVVYLVFQLIMPFRYVLFTDQVDWTGHAQRFSWRMKIQTRKVESIEYAVFDLNTNTFHPITIETYGLNGSQYDGIGLDPEMARQFAIYVKKIAKEQQHLPRVMVKAKIKVSYNGREPQLTIDPDVDLTKVPSGPFAERTWVLPLEK